MWMKQGMYVRIEGYGGLVCLPTPEGIRRNVCTYGLKFDY